MKHSLNILLIFLFPGLLFGAEEKSIEEWIAIYRQMEDDDQKSSDQEYKNIRFGAGLCLADHSGKKREIEHDRPEWKEKADQFVAFMQKRGNDILQKWLAGEALSKEDSQYLPIVQCAYISHSIPAHQKEKGRYFVLDLDKSKLGASKEYVKKVDKQGEEALKKAYFSGKLSQEDVDAIALMRISRNCTCVGGGWQLPNKLEIDGYDEPYAGYDMKPMLSTLDRAHTLESALQLPGYTDQADYAYFMDVFLRPAGTLEWLIDISGFQPVQTESGKTVIRADFSDENTATNSLKIAENLGKRPIVLFFAGSDDCYIPQFFLAFEGIHQAYKDKVAFVYINHTINDFLMRPTNFYDENPESPLHIGNAPTVEERARVSKNLSMFAPLVSVPFLIDDESDRLKATFHQVNFNFLNLTTYVIDRNGELADLWQEYFQVSRNSNELEQALQELLQNDGLRNPETKGKFVIGWQDTKEGEICAMASSCANPKADPKKRRLYLSNAVVQSVDPAAGALTVKAKLKKGEKEYTVKSTAFTRVLDMDKTITFADLKPGNKVDIEFWAEDYLGGEVTASSSAKGYAARGGIYTLKGSDGTLEAKRNSRDYKVMKGVSYKITEDSNDREITAAGIFIGLPRNSDIWIFGEITAIDPSGRVVTVARNLTDPQAMKGYRFWKEAGSKAIPDKDTKPRLQVLEQWVAHDQKGQKQTHQFCLDDATWLTFNGEYVWNIDAFQVGDKVSTNFFPAQANDAVIHPDHFRVSRVK